MAAYISFQPSDFFSPKIYTGTGATNALTGVGFQPDFTWIKDRDGGNSHMWTDAVRGSTKVIESNGTAAEATQAAGVTSYDSDGFTLGTYSGMNSNTVDFASWNWKMGTTTGIDTTGSTITPTGYSFDQTAGQSIVQYSGNNTSGAKVAHGLGAAPGMIIVKTTNTPNSWNIYHKGVDATAPEDYYMTFATDARTDDSSRWNDTAPDSVNFTLGNAAAVNGSSNTMIAYCFAEKSGYSKMGTYEGNGNADGQFIYTGFRPACIIIKISSGSGTGNWILVDTKRNGYNYSNPFLQPNLSSAEDASPTMDIVSNGFKLRSTEFPTNADGKTMIYAAFAEFPTVSSNSKAGVAR